MRRQPQLLALVARIREVKQSRGLAQEQFANEVGLDRSYYGGIERGERNVAALNLIRIASALGVEVGDQGAKLSTGVDRQGTPRRHLETDRRGLELRPRAF